MKAIYQRVRDATVALCAGLSAEDCALQSMADTSPAKWHLAHTTWFFETFLLKAAETRFVPHDARYDYLFNSYYDAVGARLPRHARGLLSRPSLDEVLAYRRVVDERVQVVADEKEWRETLALGLAHEEQHQELILTDLLHLFAQNPLAPALRAERALVAPAEAGFRHFGEGLREVGAQAGFTYDNERPRHRRFVAAYAIGNRLVTNAEYAAFIADAGYRRPELWLAEGFALAQQEQWSAPLYWQGEAEMTLAGMQTRLPEQPVAHVSYFEADAFARWAGARLPTEVEWETAAASDPPAQMFGALWQWTSSAYAAYPGFRPLAGAFGEYNGKFMVNQYVLRGSSLATPPGHSRASYRNFFPTSARWQLTGIRLAKDA